MKLFKSSTPEQQLASLRRWKGAHGPFELRELHPPSKRVDKINLMPKGTRPFKSEGGYPHSQSWQSPQAWPIQVLMTHGRGCLAARGP